MNEAKAILKTKEYPGSVSYSLHCECGDRDCSQLFSLDFDNDVLTLSIYGRIQVNSFRTGILKSIFDRYVKALKLIFTGSLFAETEIVVIGKEKIQDMIDQLQAGVDQIII